MHTPLHNFFVMQNDVVESRHKKQVTYINKLLRRLGFWHQLTPVLNPMVEMSTIEHRINFYHLLVSVIENNIEGEIVELGSFTGQCGIFFKKTCNMHKSAKTLHLYDSFEIKFGHKKNIEQELIDNFKKNNLELPVIHKGNFNKTIPHQLPEKIAFAHIDCGFGGDKNEHKQIMLFCLRHIYNRLSNGGICMLMDYHDAHLNDPGIDCNPGVKLACDDFFADKPESVISLYANQASHGYFKKI